MTRSRRAEATALPSRIKPQLTKLVDAPPEGPEWLHEIKLDGYRMHARLDRGAVRLLTRTGLDWTHKDPAIAAAVSTLPARLDGELCGIRPVGTTSFSLIQNASDTGNGKALVFFLFDLLHLDGEPVSQRPVTGRKERLRTLLSETITPLQFSDHQIGRGRAFYEQACGLKLEGIISKQADAPYAPGNRSLWLKVKCLNSEEFVVVGWTNPEGTRPHLGALLLAYYDPDGRLIYAGRAGTGIGHAELERLWRRLQPLATPKMPLDVLPPRDSRFGSPLVLSRVHWVRPELVSEVKYLTWTDDNLLRQVVHQGLREDQRAAEVRRPAPYPGCHMPAIRSLRVHQSHPTKGNLKPICTSAKTPKSDAP
jgi:DNA ligase D-like protein (predicted ligase)